LVDGRIVRISPDGGEQTVVADTGGRPLGLHVARDGRVLICDCDRGLLALDPRSGTLEVLVDHVEGRPLGFCSNVTQTADGTIYFTESTSGDFNFEQALGAFLEARGRGGVFRLALDGTVTILVDGLYFTNGVTVTADESALVFAESMGRRLSKYWLTGPQAGLVTPLAVNLPGMPDNISTGSDGRIWTTLFSQANAAGEAPGAAGGVGHRVRPRQRRSGRRHPHHPSRLRGRDGCSRIGGPTVDVDHRVPGHRLLRVVTALALSHW
jgi:sugar lactone lactonase YvrE